MVAWWRYAFGMVAVGVVASGVLLSPVALAISPGGFTAIRGATPLTGGDGSSANPFKTLYDAYRTVTTAGEYYFSVQGQNFSSYVTPGGWTLAVSGKASTNERSYAASTNMSLQSDTTLTQSTLQALDIESLRINASSGATIDVTTSAVTPIARLKSFQTLNTNTLSHQDWVGTDASKMQATCAPQTRALNLSIWQSCGVGVNLHWMPVNNAEGFANNQDTADMNLWVRSTVAPAQSPASLLWLRADDGLNCTGNNCAVTAWQDKTTGGRDAANVGAVTRTNNSINFNPTVHFDAGEYMRGASLVQNGTYTDANLYMVTRLTGPPAADYGFVEPFNADATMRFGVHNPWSDGRIYWDAGASKGNGRLATPAGLVTQGRYQLQSFHASSQSGTTVSGTSQSVALDGKVVASDNTHSPYTGVNNQYTVGGSGFIAPRDSNDVAEVIATTGMVTAQDRQRIESYLAVKYGLTLDQTTEYDYTDSSGAVVWDSGDHAGYKNNIAGVGRDDESGLNQKVSTSYSPGTIVTVALDNNFTAANDDAVRTTTHVNDRQFFMLSSSAGAVTAGTSELPAGYANRVAREWVVDKTTNFTQNTALKFAGFGSDWSLVKDADGDFSSGAARVGELDASGQIANVNLADGEYFTLARLNPAGATVTPIDTLTGEDGDTGSFSVVLNRAPTSDVTIALSSSNTGEGTVQGSVTFTPGNWSTPQIITVTGVDDNPPVGDGSVSYQIVTGDVTSSDSLYDALDGTTIDDVTMQNQNNDPPGVVVETVGNTTSEAGGTTTLQFRLLSQPVGGASVTIPLSTSDTSEGTLSASSVTIMAANWNMPAANQVTVTGVDDQLVDGNVTYSIVTGDPTSTDAGYDSLVATDVADLALINLDNDNAELIVDKTNLTVAEHNGTGTFTVRLSAQPSSDVRVLLASADSGEAMAGPSVLTFTPSNWHTPQTVTVTGVDDDIYRTDTTNVSVQIDAAGSADEFDSATEQAVAITLTDDDAPLDDADGDGISNADESLAPNGDGNGDGIADSHQTDVITRSNAVTGSYTTLVVQGPCSLNPGAFDITSESANAVQDHTYDYPLGLNHFTLDCVNPGDSTTLTFFYDKVYQTNTWDWRKYTDIGVQKYLDMNTFVGYDQAIVNGQSVTTARLTIQDGSPYDQDGQRNGKIVDPSGAAELVDSNAPGAPNTGFYRSAGITTIALIGVAILISAGVYRSVILLRARRQ